jgi:hypothetical protein
MDKTETVSVVDGIEQAWWEFTVPVYAMSGDQINVTVDDRLSMMGNSWQSVQKISWDILTSMVLVGVRLDGWPICVDGDDHVSVPYDSVIRSDEVR